MKADKIYLVGFMGAGKSTVARALGQRLDWRVEDIDERIERAERRDIPTIFRDNGEPYFRAREREALIELLPERGVVVATGGGTFADAAQSRADAARRRGGLAGRAVCHRRSAASPPTAAGRWLPIGWRMEQLYNQRLAAYRLAHFRVDAGRGSVEELSITSWSGLWSEAARIRH